jgi:uncharacterized protein
MAPGHAEDIRTRLRRALPAAMKARDRTTVAALRSALAAIDNAEAVEVNTPPPATRPQPAPSAATDEGPGTPAPATPGTGATREAGATQVAGGSRAGGSPVAGAVVGLGAGEVERRRLTATEMEAIVRREVTERRTAARAYRDAGRSDHAERLRAEADRLSSYLSDPDTPA